MSPERCDFCRRRLTPEEPRHSYRLGAATLFHCDRPECRAKGKEWRVQRLKECAEALHLITRVDLHTHSRTDHVPE